MARPVRSDDCSLDRLTAALERELDGVSPADVDGTRVASLLREYAAGEDSWRRYAAAGDDSYSRNLIWRARDFELLLLCWKSGQASAIHDHGDQNCWMAVLDGALEEEHFSARDGGLKRGRVKTYEAGGVAFIRDEIALHQIRATGGRDGVSLHLYARAPSTAASPSALRPGTPPGSRSDTPASAGRPALRPTPKRSVAPGPSDPPDGARRSTPLPRWSLTGRLELRGRTERHSRSGVSQPLRCVAIGLDPPLGVPPAARRHDDGRSCAASSAPELAAQRAAQMREAREDPEGRAAQPRRPAGIRSRPERRRRANGPCGGGARRHLQGRASGPLRHLSAGLGKPRPVMDLPRRHQPGGIQGHSGV